MRHFRRDSFSPRQPNQFLITSPFSKNDAISKYYNSPQWNIYLCVTRRKTLLLD
jgi:hypothetical protein